MFCTALTRYLRGRRRHCRNIEGVWVVGGVERTDQRKAFLTTVTNRNSDTMRDIIRRFVLPGSIIHTDCWAAYNMISDMGQNFTHCAVSHSVGFVSVQNGLRIPT